MRRLSFVLLIVSSACSRSESTSPLNVDDFANVASVSIELPTGMTAGSSARATVVLRDAANKVLSIKGVTFASADPYVAVVDATGLITARQPGEATIIARAGSKSAQATMKVEPAPPAECGLWDIC